VVFSVPHKHRSLSFTPLGKGGGGGAQCTTQPIVATFSVVPCCLTFPGGCTSSYEALSQGTLVVSLPSDSLRGRFTQAMLTRFGLEDMIATSLDDLIHMAVKVRRCPLGLSFSQQAPLCTGGCAHARSHQDVASRVLLPRVWCLQKANAVAALSPTERRKQQGTISSTVQARGLGDMTPLHEWTTFLLRATAAHRRFVYDHYRGRQ
jgi:hypothetical protein